jgi:hypothetical protein
MNATVETPPRRRRLFLFHRNGNGRRGGSGRGNEINTLITLTCNPSMQLEQRLELLTYAFAKVTQGARLEEIVEWRIKDGVIRFILSGGAANPGPRGEINAKIEDDDVSKDVNVNVAACI